jgi:hypothetical protein
MDGGIEQNPAYGTAHILNLQYICLLLLARQNLLTTRFTPYQPKSVFLQS